MPSINLKFLEINPANLLGKLHKAAVAKVQEKYGKDVAISNSFIDLDQKNDPKAVLKDGEYYLSFTLNNDEFDKKKIMEPVVEYVRWFAGDDVANKVKAKGGNWFTRMMNRISGGKMFKKSTASEIEKNKHVNQETNTTTFNLKYTIRIKEGTLDQGQFKKQDVKTEAEEFFGESLSISMSFPFLVESVSFSPFTQYSFVERQILKESMKKKAEKIIKNVSEKNFTEANKVLEELIQQKMNARVEDVLSAQKK